MMYTTDYLMERIKIPVFAGQDHFRAGETLQPTLPRFFNKGCEIWDPRALLSESLDASSELRTVFSSS